MAKPLDLTIPDQNKRGRNAFNIRPKKVEQWLDDLPRANLGETARLLYNALNEVNQTSYSYADRFRFLETLREPIQYVTDSLKKHFTGVSYPLPVKNQKIAAATRELLAAMATGYRVAIHDTLKKNSLFIDKKILTILLHRAVVYRGRTLLTSYQIYAPCAPKLWQELHQLYTIAETRKLHLTAIADHQLLYLKKSSIQSEYIRLLLLALTSPYRLRQGEVSKVYQVLEGWTRYCKLARVDEIENAEEGSFAVLLNRDAPPRSLALLSSRDCKPEQCRLINTQALAELIRNEIRDTAEMATSTFVNGLDLSKPDLSHDLLRRLLAAWAIESRRGFSRTRKQEKVDVSIGLSAIHRFISHRHSQHKAGSARFDNNQALFASNLIENINDQKPDIWNMVYPTRLEGFTPLMEQDIAYASKTNDEPPLLEESWVIINESAGGYCLEYQEGKSAHAQVGELVGIRRHHPGNNGKWSIGVVRWLKFSNSRSLRLGVEMLNPDVAAIGIRSASSHKGDPYQRTLMLPEIPAIRQPNTLITPPSPWRVGNQAILNILGKERHIKLTGATQCSGLFSQFTFTPLDERKSATEKPRSEHWELDKDFGNIWSSM